MLILTCYYYYFYCSFLYFTLILPTPTSFITLIPIISSISTSIILSSNVMILVCSYIASKISFGGGDISPKIVPIILFITWSVSIIMSTMNSTTKWNLSISTIWSTPILITSLVLITFLSVLFFYFVISLVCTFCLAHHLLLLIYSSLLLVYLFSLLIHHVCWSKR